MAFRCRTHRRPPDSPRRLKLREATSGKLSSKGLSVLLTRVITQRLEGSRFGAHPGTLANSSWHVKKASR
jgi:hypothetical protein